MRHDAKGNRLWLPDLTVLARFTVLNFLLVFVGVIGTVGFGWGTAGKVWLWVFAFPCSLAAALRSWEPVVWVLLGLNPFIYGVLWWFMWKMFWLMRSKPTDDELPTAHNE